MSVKGTGVQLIMAGTTWIGNTAQIQQVSGGAGTAMGGAVYVSNSASSFSCMVNGSSFISNSASALTPSSYTSSYTTYLYGTC